MNHELLAPAGDMECLRSAIDFGADAVYVGGPGLQLRSHKVGFDRETLERAVEYVHARNKKLYVTVNSFARNDEIAFAREYGSWLQSIGADAAIISDPGVMAAVHSAAPRLEIHVSTQANCTNYMSARVYYEMGARRVVPARELTLAEIRELREKLPEDMDIECFVHGAMCISYSGRCLISSYLNSRSGNRGECTQPCRWNWALMEQSRQGQYFPVFEDEAGTSILSSHDMNCLDILDQLKDAGIKSFKIEGRMKTAFYVATVVNAYRNALDGTASLEYCRRELDTITHRPYNTGFYFGNVQKHSFNDGKYRQDCTFIANVLGWEDGLLTLCQRNRFFVGDTLEILEPGHVGRSIRVEKIITSDGTETDSAPHPMEILKINCPFRVAEGAMLRRRDSQKENA